jgi:methionine sulfoxide reductase catalytic subunit
MIPIKSSEITPEHVFNNRRQFMKGVGAVAIGAVVLAACAPGTVATPAPTSSAGSPDAGGRAVGGQLTDELGDPANTYEQITNYNNYYEFDTDKEAVAKLAANFPTSPWTVQVGGLVRNPKTYGIEDILKVFEQEERIYRLRCVEAWSMVIPWQGFPLAKLLKEVEPTADAKYLRFESVLDPENMPGQRSNWFDWPYVEGLRLDEAMNDLAILATGLYGKPMPAQNGAPIRLVAPWKYGFKSIKGIVKIDLVAERPTSLWMASAPREYGFYANVNPEVSHPRWSQASERRIGESGRRRTLPFNGYGDEVAQLYDAMDLRANF